VASGTTSPQARLALGTSVGAKLLLYDNGAGINNGFFLDTPAANDVTLTAHVNGAIVFGKTTSAATPTFGTEFMRITNGGNVTGTYGDYHVSSDIRRKKDIVTIPNALDKVLALRGVNFKWKDSSQDDNLHMGMIAQEVEKVVPEVVHIADDEMRIKAVEYQYMVGLLVEAIKEQQRQIQALRQDIEQLERNL